MSVNERVDEITFCELEENLETPEFSYDCLLEQKNKSPQKSLSIKILKIKDKSQPNNIVYNGGVYMEKDSLVLIARSELLNSEIACIKKYGFNGEEFFTADDCKGFSESQDPSPFYHPNFGVMYSLVKTYSSKNDPEKIINYRSVLCLPRETLDEINYF